MEQFIVEVLTRPDGPPCRRTDPMTQEEADTLVVKLHGLHTRIVPAEKYAPKLRESKADKPEETGPNNYRSRVE